PKQLPPGNPALQAYDQIRKAGLGPNISIALRKPDNGAITSLKDLNAIQKLEEELQGVPHVSGVAGPGLIAPRAQLLPDAPKQIRTAQSEFGLLLVPAQVVEKQLKAANSDLAQATIGKTDPAVLRAIIDLAAALAADTGTGPIPGGPSVPGYNGLAASIAQAQ